MEINLQFLILYMYNYRNNSARRVFWGEFSLLRVKPCYFVPYKPHKIVPLKICVSDSRQHFRAKPTPIPTFPQIKKTIWGKEHG
jgi:hypothetical protein